MDDNVRSFVTIFQSRWRFLGDRKTSMFEQGIPRVSEWIVPVLRSNVMSITCATNTVETISINIQNPSNVCTAHRQVRPFITFRTRYGSIKVGMLSKIKGWNNWFEKPQKRCNPNLIVEKFEDFNGCYCPCVLIMCPRKEPCQELY